MLKKLGIMSFVWLLPAVAFAQEGELPDPDSLGALLPAIVEAAKGGQWSLFVSLLLMILVWLATKVPFIRDWLPKAAKPWVVTVSAVVLSVAVTAATSGDWVAAIVNGLITGSAATGLWELVGKKLLTKSSDEEVVEEDEEATTEE